jgi:hypothetical protein
MNSRTQGGGDIDSTAGFIGDRFVAVYSAAKGGVHAFTDAWIGQAAARSLGSPPPAGS